MNAQPGRTLPGARAVHRCAIGRYRDRRACPGLAPSGACSPPAPQDGDPWPGDRPAGPPVRHGPSATARSRRRRRARRPAPTAGRARADEERGDRGRPGTAAAVAWPSPASPRCSASAWSSARRPPARTRGCRSPIVIFGVQVLFVLAWTMAMRPPALLLVGRRLRWPSRPAADVAAVQPQIAAPGAAGLRRRSAASSLAVLGQLVRPADRMRVTDVARRHPADRGRRGRVRDADRAQPRAARHPGHHRLPDRDRRRADRRPAHRRGLPRPRLAPQVPRGAAGVVVGAMARHARRGRARQLLVLPFTPDRGRDARPGRGGRRGAGRPGGRTTPRRAGRWPASRRRCGWPGTCRARWARFALAAPAAYAMTVFVPRLSRRRTAG